MLKLSWLLPLATLFQEMSALKKEGKGYEEIKRGKCPKPRKKRKSETRGKNGQVSDKPERKEKENVEHPILLKKFQRARTICIPSKENK